MGIEGKFRNGLRYIIVPLEQKNNLVNISIFINVGSRDESEDKIGLSHYLEHMIFRGSKEYPSNNIIFQKFDSLGAQFNAHTDHDLTFYYSKSLSIHLKEIIKLWSSLLFNPCFEKKHFDKERTVILQEINNLRSNPSSEIWEPFEKLMFKGTQLEKGIGGTKETLNNITLDYLKKFYAKYYVPCNMSICICGDITEDEALKLLCNSLFQSKDSPKFSRDIPYKIPKKINSKGPKKCILTRKGQSNILIGFPSYDFGNLDKVAGQFMKNIIAGLVSSRLFLSIRENRGLVYGISSDLNTYYEGGYYAIKTSTEPKYTSEVINLITAEIKNICSEGIQKDEFEKVKNYLYNKTFIYAEDINNLGLYYNKQLAYWTDIITYEDYRESIKKITITEVNDFCRSILDINKMICVYTKPE